MAERPILFSSPMVRAILDGRKTQTRRVVARSERIANAHAGQRQYRALGYSDSWYENPKNIETMLRTCPYGVPGDRLWVRETWCPCRCVTIYRADCGDDRPSANTDDWNQPLEDRWRPSIYMPRWASRITLEVVSVRVERLNEISVTDCHAEGIQPTWDGGDYELTAFEQLWDSINAKRHPWASNPWVWVVEFKRSEATDAK